MKYKIYEELRSLMTSDVRFDLYAASRGSRILQLLYFKTVFFVYS